MFAQGLVSQYVVLREGGEPVTLDSTGPPLGLLPPGLPYGETLHTLGVGDLLALFSDGVTEAQNETSAEFGEARLLDVLRGARDAPVEVLIDSVFDAIDRFAGDAPQFDDITMLVVRRCEWVGWVG